MTTLLRQVLDSFDETHGPRTLTQLACDLDVSPGMLEGMLDYWVRKGRLRESGGPSTCMTCGSAAGCPFAPKLPRSYELVTDDDPLPPCGGCH